MQNNKKAMNRQEQIKDLLLVNGSVSLQELCRIFHCSPATIRNDLTFLEKQGSLKRMYGGAIPNENTASNTSMDNRIQKNRIQKNKIAKYVVEHILKENMVITLDSGTTTMEVAEEIVKAKLPCTIITNSFRVATVLSTLDCIKLIVTGGIYDFKHESFHDEVSDLVLKNYQSEICFISPNGINEMGIVTNSGSSENAIKKSMMKQSTYKILLADSSKIGKTELNVLGNVNDFTCLVTDPGIKAEMYEKLKSIGYDIKVA